MSRVAKNPVVVPAGITVSIDGNTVSVKNSKVTLTKVVHSAVEVVQEGNVLRFAPRDNSIKSNALAGTTRALIKNLVMGATHPYERKLELVGVGYRAQAQGKVLTLALGYSHPVVFEAPEGITIETPSQTEIMIKGVDKHLVGQVAAKIRGFRSPECYKGKGIRYSGEKIKLKEAKKKK